MIPETESGMFRAQQVTSGTTRTLELPSRFNSAPDRLSPYFTGREKELEQIRNAF